MPTWIQDLRFALRMLARRPAFSAVGILTLALGICATTTIFSVVDAVLLHPLPYEEADELYMVRNRNVSDGRLAAAAWREFETWREATEGDFRGMATYVDRPYNVTGIEEPVQVWSAQVSRGFFDLIGVEAVRGRTLSDEEQTAGGPRVVMVSHGFWQRWLGGDPQVVGSTIELDEESYEVIGVLPAGFRSPTESVELWLSVEPMRERLPQDLGLKFFSVVARLPEGMNREQGEQRLRPVGERLAAEHPRSNAGLLPTLIPMREQILGDVRPALWMLFAAGVLVLAIACLNVANLLLVRANGRRREFAVRSALGVSAGRLFRQLLTESALFAVIGGVLGLLLTLFTLRLLPSLLPAGVLPATSELALDAPVLGLTTLLVALISIGFGLTPLARAGRRAALVDDAPRSSGGGGGKVSRRLRNTLVVGEVALALVLLVCASLLITSLQRLQSVDLGFEQRGVLSLYMLVPESRYPDAPARQRFLGELLDRLERLPGVDSAGMVTHLPLGNNDISEEVEIEGRPPASGEAHRAAYRAVYGNYFDALDIPLVRGRLLERTDHEADRAVVLINETFAERYFPDLDPIDRRISLEGMLPETPGFGEMSSFRVVGVVGDVRHRAVDTAPQAEVFLPYPSMAWSVFFIAVRTTGAPPLAIAEETRQAVWAIDPDLPIADLLPMADRVDAQVAQPRFTSGLLTAFSLLAFLLAAMGVYGVVSYAASERTHEIGVRMSFGADRGDVSRLVLGSGMRLVVVGIVLGLVAAFFATRLLASLLYEVSARDPWSFVVAVVALVVASLLACWLPARRAARLDPREALLVT